MSKELEALEVSKQLKDFVLEFVKNGLDRRFIHGSFDIIETALKDYERRLKLAKEYEDVNKVGKRLKALEIIKEKKVNVNLLFISEDVNQYNFYINANVFQWETRTLTKEEYDFLKEVLL